MRRASPASHPVLAGFAFVAAFAATLLVALDATVFHNPSAGIRLLAGALTLAGVAVSARIVLHGVVAVIVSARAHRDVRRRGSARVVAGVPVVVLRDNAPLAFCVGPLRPTIVLSSGAIATLDNRELAAVVAHEQHHARRRDTARAIVIGAFVSGFGRRRAASAVAEHYATGRELAADRAAVRGQGAEALAAALLRADAWPGGAIHETRVDRLLGAPCPRRIAAVDGLSIAAATAILTTSAVVIVISTGCPTGADGCAEHLHPAAVTAFACLAALGAGTRGRHRCHRRAAPSPM